MGQAFIKQRRWRAYSHAATAAAINVGKIIRIGDLDLAADYRSMMLEEIGRALRLDLTTRKIPGAACLILNWPILAQVNIGAPHEMFDSETLAEMAIEADPVGLNLMQRHWTAIEGLADALLRQDRLTEADARQHLDRERAGLVLPDPLDRTRRRPVQVRDPVKIDSRQLSGRSPLSH